MYQRLLNSKTVLEYLVVRNEQSYTQIGKLLNITPQQFSDWIKLRRPIPNERLKSLCDYFAVPADVLVNEKKFAKPLDPITKIDVEMLEVNKATKEEDSIILKEKLIELQKEKAKQVRILRLTTMLNADNDQLNAVIDTFLDQLENIEESDINLFLEKIRV
ncbi:XRE family transcriptional regulator [Bacillus sp. SM2101]|uniref:XRE family transcriptional regulator n=1 Tax=Bacillus sp. SM2101 TaxID=2805366 RepID=UPI001BDEA1E5|nr:XRE family transcriptional regulator [Bacillus sp. SM2101]